MANNPDPPGRIVVVDDDATVADVVGRYLVRDGHTVECVHDGYEALRRIADQPPDLVVLDLMLPGIDGLEVCRRLRERWPIPVVMLTALGDETDRLAGFEIGADDYVTKPFRLNVLLARLRAHLRQSEQSDDAVFTIGPYTFRPSAKLLTDQSGRKKVRLTEKETAILKYLYRAGDRAIGRDTLLDEVWGYNAAVTTHTLETHVYRLRQKIERDPTRAEILVTDTGGYRLVT